MGRVKKIEIKESSTELLKAISGEKRPLVQARGPAFYLYQSGQAQHYDAGRLWAAYGRPAV
jgi:hypothetical protein